MFRSIRMPMLIGVLALSWFSSASQTAGIEFYFDRYGPEQGLQTRQIRTMVQTADGFIWMATNEGLVRYDGEEFTLFFDQDVPPDISNNRYVESMILDDQDRIWMASNEKLVVYHTRVNRWQYLRDSSGSASVFPLRFAYDPHHHRMWIGCERGLCYVDESLQVNWFSFSGNTYDKLPYNTLALQNDSALWLGNTYGYFRLNPATKQIAEFHIPGHNPAVKNADGIFSSYIMEDSILWLGGWGTGLIKHDLIHGTSSQYFYSEPLKELNAVYDIRKADLPGHSGWLWVGTYKGLMAFDMHTGTFIPYHTDDLNNTRGVTGTVFCLFSDSDRALWIGGGDGLFRFDPRKQGIEKIVFPQFEKCFSVQQMAFEKVNADETRMWFTIPYCGSHIYNLLSKRIEPFPELLEKELKEVGIFEIFIDKNRMVWLGTNERGLLVYDIDRKNFTSYSGKNFIDKGSWVTDIVEGPGHTIWMGTYNGLFRFDEVLKQFHEVDPVRKLIDAGSISSHIHSVATDVKGNIWAATHFDNKRSGSLLCYDTLRNTVLHFDRQTTRAFANVNEFRDVVCTEDGTLLITTDRGLFAMGEGDIRKLRDFPEFNTSLGPSTSSLTVDRENGVWIASAFGVSRLNLDKNTLYTYNYTNSLLGRQYNPTALYDSYSDRVYVTQKGGIDVIKTSPPANHPVKLFLQELFINLVRADTPGYNLKDLTHDQNDIRIRLALPYYSDPGNNIFRYTLEGYDNNWTSSNSGVVQYNNLPPGHYSFKAMGITSEGQQSVNTISVPFYIHPPFYKTWWFQIAVLVLVSGLIMVFFLYRESQKRRLQQMRDAIARDLHDDMGSNLSTIKLLSEFELMKQGAGEQPILRTILDKTNLVMESMYEIIWSINPAKGQSSDIIERIKRYSIETLEPLDIRIRFDIPVSASMKERLISMEHRRHVFLIFKEAINNIAKYARATQVVFGVKVEHRLILLTLQDNGTGFEMDTIRPGNGLLNMKTRALALNGTLVIQSKPGEGTTVRLQLPYGG